MHLECNGVQIIWFVFACSHLEYCIKIAIVCLVHLTSINVQKKIIKNPFVKSTFCYMYIIIYHYMTINFFLIELYEYCLILQFPQRLSWTVILTSRDVKIGKPLLLILASREVNITFQRLLWNDQN
jgi:hypothetical protein